MRSGFAAARWSLVADDSQATHHFRSSSSNRDRQSARSSPAAKQRHHGVAGFKQRPRPRDIGDRPHGEEVVGSFSPNAISGATSRPCAYRISLAITRVERQDRAREPQVASERLALARTAMLAQQRSARGQLVNLERRCIAGVDLDRPGIAVMKHVVDAEPADEPEPEAERFPAFAAWRPGLGDRPGPDASPVGKRRAGDADQLPRDADQSRRHFRR